MKLSAMHKMRLIVSSLLPVNTLALPTMKADVRALLLLARVHEANGQVGLLFAY